MILDRLDNILTYKGISNQMDTAIDWLVSTNLDSLLSTDRFEIDGANVFAMLQEYDTFDPAELKADGAPRKTFEGHKKYIDIQLILSGAEVMEYAPLRPDTPVLVPYDTEKDIYKADPKTEDRQNIVVNAGNFAIFFPEDLHKPCMNVDGTQHRVKKLVIKALTK